MYSEFGDVLVGAVAGANTDGQLFLLHQAPVEPAGTTVQHTFDNVERVKALVAHFCRLKNQVVHVGSVGALDHQAFFSGLFRITDGERRERLPCRDIREILLDHFHGSRRVQIPRQHKDSVTGLVILAVVFRRHFPSQVVYIARPADGGHAVRKRLVNHRVQGLDVATRRLVVVTHASFFADHGTLRIELPQYGVLHTVRFQPHEQLDLVLGKRHDIGRHQVRGEGVESCAACRLVGAPQFILHENLAVFVHHGIVFRRELLDRSRVDRQFRRANQGLQRILYRHEPGIGNAVGNAHLVRALEKLVLQHVGKSGLARNFVNGPRHIEKPATHRRSLGVRVQQDRKAVIQHFLVDRHVHCSMSGPCHKGQGEQAA